LAQTAKDRMSELLGLSFDAVTAPLISLRSALVRRDAGGIEGKASGWGFGWYPGAELAGQIIKNPTAGAEDPAARALKDWSRFGSTIFVCHFLGSAKHRSQSDAQPFLRNYSGRAWIVAHSGTLKGNEREKLPLGDKPGFEPVGRTDTEHLFCWLLNRMQAAGTRSLRDYGWGQLAENLSHINELGPLNLLLADGQSLAVYHDREDGQPIFWSRRIPPHAQTPMSNNVLTLALDTHQSQRSYIVFATTPLTDEAWVKMAPGQLLIARRGQIFWDSLKVWDRAGSPQQQATRQAASAASPVIALFPPALDGSTYVRSDTDAELIDSGMPSSPETRDQWPLHWNKRDGALEKQRPSRVLNVLHETVYRYARQVEASQHVLRLQPVHDSLQALEQFDLRISVDGQVHNYEDVFGNHTVELGVDQPFTEFVVRAESRVRVSEAPALYTLAPHRREQIPLVWMPWQRQMMLAYMLPAELPETHLTELLDFAMSFVERNDHNLRDTLIDMNRTIYKDFKYLPGVTTLETTPYEVFSSHQGVCQDFANLFICMARLMNIPARYRVGYVDTHATTDNPIQSEASHAWTELYLPGAGWIGFDPTNGTLVGQEHVRVACGRNYRDATPTTGTLFKGGGGESLQITVKVETEAAGS
jgi:transglutaminase-like putative cysteine protease/predicted glutamine amidotransferase